MKTIEITPRKLGGVIQIPPSKSVSHRAVLCAALADGQSEIQNILLSDDIRATCEAMTALGAGITYQPEAGGRYTLIIDGCREIDACHKTVDCIESGSTLRFMIPLMAVRAQNSRVIGQGRLVKRPMQPYYDLFDEQGIVYEKEAEGQELPLCFSGQLKAGTYRLRGDISSQFITGLLYALPLLSGDSIIEITTALESRPYIDITLEVLKAFGIRIDVEEGALCRFRVPGNQHYQARSYRVEGDYSQGAFWLVGGILGQKMDCRDLPKTSVQGDQAIVDIIRQMKGEIISQADGFTACPSATEGTVIDVSQCPDLVPILAVLASVSVGTTEIVNAARLRFKESDRLQAMNEVLTALGADVTENPEGLTIKGVSALTGGQVDSHNDHRIAMATAMASMVCIGKVILTGAESVRKSYPDFWEDFKTMGGDIRELDLGQ